MNLLPLFPFAAFAVGALLSRLPRAANAVAAMGSVIAALAALLTGGNWHASAAFSPDGAFAFALRLDHLSQVFVVISSIAWIVVSLGAIRSAGERDTLGAVGVNLACFGLYLVLLSAAVVSFMIGWELMTIFVFMLIARHVAEPRHAFRFLAFGELSSVLLLLGFVVSVSQTGTIALTHSKAVSGVFLVFVTLGAVVKMDVVPFHTWMKDAYHHIPGYLGVLASVAVTLAGVYALERFLTVGPAVVWWLLVLILLGAFSAFYGALQSTGARGLRTVPAYSTVEYNGMILCAAGFSALAATGPGKSLEYLSLFAGAAAVVLTLSHALAKALFFLSLGDAADESGALRFADLRSIWKNVGKMPGLGIMVAGLSFAAVPPLIGYSGEWMLIEATFQSFRFHTFAERFVASFSGVFLALAMGLTAFAMARYIGYIVLGNDDPPSTAPSGPARRRPAMLVRAVELVLILLVPATGIGLPAVLRWSGFGTLLGGLLGVPRPLLLVSGTPTFGVLSPTFFAVVILVLSGIPLAVWARRRRSFRRVGAWSGGLEPVGRERFTSDAFAQILQHILRFYTRARAREEGGSVSLQTRDALERIWRGLARLSDTVATAVSRVYMNGRISWYVTYILAVFVIVLLVATL